MENDDEEYGKEGLSNVHSFAYETRVCWQRFVMMDYILLARCTKTGKCYAYDKHISGKFDRLRAIFEECFLHDLIEKEIFKEGSIEDYKGLILAKHPKPKLLSVEDFMSWILRTPGKSRKHQLRLLVLPTLPSSGLCSFAGNLTLTFSLAPPPELLHSNPPVSDHLVTLQEQLGNMSTCVDEISSRLSGYECRFAYFDSRFEAIYNGYHHQFTESFASVQHDLSVMTATLARLESHIALDFPSPAQVDDEDDEDMD
ncbi:hypothetical protein C3L33_11643, partial [Rhododendron williamsianum]